MKSATFCQKDNSHTNYRASKNAQPIKIVPNSYKFYRQIFPLFSSGCEKDLIRDMTDNYRKKAWREANVHFGSATRN